MASIARVVLRRNNSLNPRQFRRQPPSTSVGIPRCYFRYSNGADDGHTYSLPSFFHDKNGTSPLTSSPGASITQKQAKQPSSKDSSDDESEADDDEGLPPKLSSVKQDNEAIYFKMEMPGVRKEDAKVYLKGNTLMAKGVRKSDSQFEDGKDGDGISYVGGVSLMSMQNYKIAEIKAEMKDGLLKVKVPKLKDEERADVLHIQID